MSLHTDILKYTKKFNARESVKSFQMEAFNGTF